MGGAAAPPVIVQHTLVFLMNKNKQRVLYKRQWCGCEDFCCCCCLKINTELSQIEHQRILGRRAINCDCPHYSSRGSPNLRFRKFKNVGCRVRLWTLHP